MYSARAARRSVELSFLAYSEDEDDLWADGWFHVHSWGDNTTRGYCVGCSGIFFVTVAGTVNPLSDPRGVLQWLSHLDFRQVPHDGGAVHGKWLANARAIAGQVVDILNAYNPPIIYLCGHSYGGVVAQLLRRFLVDAGLPVTGIYTFGAPAVGDAAYAAAQPASLVWRAERALDIVSMTPLTLAPNQLLHDWLMFVGDNAPIDFQALGVQYKKAGTLLWLPGERSRALRINSIEGEKLIQTRRLEQLMGVVLGRQERWWLPVNDHDIWKYRAQYRIN